MGGWVMCAIVSAVLMLMAVNVDLSRLIFRIVERLHDFREAAARLSGSGCTNFLEWIFGSREADFWIAISNWGFFGEKIGVT